MAICQLVFGEDIPEALSRRLSDVGEEEGV